MSELKMLRVARALGAAHAARGSAPALLAAHAVPPEYRRPMADAYINHIISRHPAGRDWWKDLVDAVDAFAETVGFSADADRTAFRRGARLLACR